MDASTLLMPLLAQFLPPEATQWIRSNILDSRSPFQLYKHQALAYARQAFDALYPLVRPLIDRAAQNEGALGFAALLALLVAVFVVISWVHRMVMWWTRLAMRAVFWAAVLAVVAWAWQRGPLESARDAVVVGSKLFGFLAGIKDVWVEEYRRYDAQQTMGSTRGRSSGR